MTERQREGDKKKREMPAHLKMKLFNNIIYCSSIARDVNLGKSVS